MILDLANGINGENVRAAVEILTLLFLLYRTIVGTRKQDLHATAAQIKEAVITVESSIDKVDQALRRLTDMVIAQNSRIAKLEVQHEMLMDDVKDLQGRSPRLVARRTR